MLGVGTRFERGDGSRRPSLLGPGVQIRASGPSPRPLRTTREPQACWPFCHPLWPFGSRPSGAPSTYGSECTSGTSGPRPRRSSKCGGAALCGQVEAGPRPLGVGSDLSTGSDGPGFAMRTRCARGPEDGDKGCLSPLRGIGPPDQMRGAGGPVLLEIPTSGCPGAGACQVPSPRAGAVFGRTAGFRSPPCEPPATCAVDGRFCRLVQPTSRVERGQGRVARAAGGSA
jgi:hypothetical protein